MKQHTYRTLWLLLLSLWAPLAVLAQTYPSPWTSQAVYRVINQGSGWSLESGGSANVHNQPGNPTNQYNYENNANQQWLIVRMTSSAFNNVIIVNRATGKVLGTDDDSWGTYATMNEWSSDPDVNKRQRWNLVDNGLVSSPAVTSWTIMNAFNNLALEIGSASTTMGAKANQFPDNGLAHQRWQIQDITPYEQTNIIHSMDDDFPLEIFLGDHADGVAVIQSPERYGVQISGYNTVVLFAWAQQQWYLRNVGNDVAIISRYSQKAMQVGGTYTQTMTSGQPVTQSTDTGADNQLWTITPCGCAKNWSYIQNKRSGLYLTASNTTAGAPIIQATFANNNSQQWRINASAMNRTTNPTGQMAPGVTEAAVKRSADLTAALTLYPNPASTILSVAVAEISGGLTSVQITDVRGSSTKARYLGNGQVNVADLAPGLYLITVAVGQQQYRQKFVKE